MLGWQSVSSEVCGVSLSPEGNGNISFVAKEARSPVSQHSSRSGRRMAIPHRSSEQGEHREMTDKQDLEEITSGFTDILEFGVWVIHVGDKEESCQDLFLSTVHDLIPICFFIAVFHCQTCFLLQLLMYAVLFAWSSFLPNVHAGPIPSSHRHPSQLIPIHPSSLTSSPPKGFLRLDKIPLWVPTEPHSFPL